jgi:hypothetical protein
MAFQEILNKEAGESGLTSRNKINSMFEELYAISNDNKINITQSSLRALANSNELLPFRFYRITDTRTKHQIPGTNIIHTGALEPLTVLALSNNKIHKIAYSENYPQDIIHYDINDIYTENFVAAIPGTITVQCSSSTSEIPTGIYTGTLVYENTTYNYSQSYLHATALDLLTHFREWIVDRHISGLTVGNIILHPSGTYYYFILSGNIADTTMSSVLTFQKNPYTPQVGEIRTGKIYYREDTELNYIRDYDFRNVKFRLYKCNQEEWAESNTYTKTDVIGTSSQGISQYYNITGWNRVTYPTLYLRIRDALGDSIEVFPTDSDRTSGTNKLADIISGIVTEVSGSGFAGTLLTDNSYFTDNDTFNIAFTSYYDLYKIVKVGTKLYVNLVNANWDMPESGNTSYWYLIADLIMNDYIGYGSAIVSINSEGKITCDIAQYIDVYSTYIIGELTNSTGISTTNGGKFINNIIRSKVYSKNEADEGGFDLATVNYRCIIIVVSPDDITQCKNVNINAQDVCWDDADELYTRNITYSGKSLIQVNAIDNFKNYGLFYDCLFCSAIATGGVDIGSRLVNVTGKFLKTFVAYEVINLNSNHILSLITSYIYSATIEYIRFSIIGEISYSKIQHAEGTYLISITECLIHNIASAVIGEITGGLWHCIVWYLAGVLNNQKICSLFPNPEYEKIIKRIPDGSVKLFYHDNSGDEHMASI